MATRHVVFFPSAGMGHLLPFMRLAAMVASHNCKVTFITAHPTVSAAESNKLASFFTTFPHINCLEFHLLPDKPSSPTIDDPFFVQFDKINRSMHLLPPLLSSLHPSLSAIFADFAVTSSISQVADSLSIPFYIVSTTSARFHSLIAYLPHLTFENNATEDRKYVNVPGLAPLPISTIPPPFFNPNHFFTAFTSLNTSSLSKAKGVLMNTFNWFDRETIDALENARILSNFPPLLPVGPFKPFNDGQSHQISWLEDQPAQSLVYVSFGSRTAMSKDQLRELGEGLVRSGQTFLWVLKANKVDKDDNTEIQELLGRTFLERTKDKGIIVKQWVNQEEVLAHPAIGGFVSHCGWNSVMEAARLGVPILAWPQHGDQKVNAEVAEKAGLAIWARDWGWAGERLVKGEEIGEKIVELMQNKNLKAKAREVGEKARQAAEMGGSSAKVLQGIINTLNLKKPADLY